MHTLDKVVVKGKRITYEELKEMENKGVQQITTPKTYCQKLLSDEMDNNATIKKIRAITTKDKAKLLANND